MANGTVQKGTDNVEDRTEDRTRKAQPPRPPEHRSMTVTVQAGDGVVGGDSSATATRGYGNGWTTRGMNVTEARQRREAADKAARDAAYRADKAARDAHRADLERNAYRMNAATQRRDAREARAREEARRAERAKTTIDAAEWEKAGQRNGQLRTEEVKNADGSLVMGADKKPVVKTFRNEGSMFDPTKNADAVAAVEKWWQDSGGQFTTGHGVPKGTFDKNGKLQAANLTSDQFAQLQRLQGAFDEKMAPIRQAQAMRDAQSYLKASELVQQNGVQVWDTRTGERRLSRDQVMEAARRIQTQSAYGALANLGNAASLAEGGRYYGEGGMDRMLADEQTVISRMRDLGFKANEITNDQGRLEVQRASAALLSRAQQEQARQAPAAAPKAAPRPAAKPAAVQPAAQPAPAPKPTAVPKAAPKAEVKPEIVAEVAPAVVETSSAQPEAQSATQPEAPRGMTDFAREHLSEWLGTADAKKAVEERQARFAMPIFASPAKEQLAQQDRPQMRGMTTEEFNNTLTQRLARMKAGGQKPVDPMVRDLQSRGLNPLETAAQIAGAVPAGVVQAAGGTARILTGGDVRRGLTDVAIGGLAAAGGAQLNEATLPTPKGGSLPYNTFAGGAAPGTKGGVRAQARRLEARAAEGEGVINPRVYSSPLGRAETRRVEANYRRGAEMKKAWDEANAKAAREAEMAGHKKALDRRSRAEKRDLEKMDKAVKRGEATAKARATREVTRRARDDNYRRALQRVKHNLRMGGSSIAPGEVINRPAGPSLLFR